MTVKDFDGAMGWLILLVGSAVAIVLISAFGWYLAGELVDAGHRRDCRSAGNVVVRPEGHDSEWRCERPKPERAP